MTKTSIITTTIMPKKNGNVNLKVYRNNIELEKKTCTEGKQYSAGFPVCLNCVCCQPEAYVGDLVIPQVGHLAPWSAF